jgi:hypothetical protein
MQAMRRWLMLGLLLGLAGLSTGCLAVAAGGAAGGTAAYAYGDTETTLDAEPEAVVEAARATFKAMEIATVGFSHHGKQRQLKGRTTNDESVKVTVEPRGEATKIWIRVGFFGDAPLSQQILSRVKDRL